MVQYFFILPSSKNKKFSSSQNKYHAIVPSYTPPNLYYYNNVNFCIYMTLSLTLKRMLKMQAKDQKKREENKKKKNQLQGLYACRNCK